MADSTDDAEQRAAYWPVALVRAIPAALLAILVTFTLDHSAHFGLVVFGGFGVLSGALLIALAVTRLQASGVGSFFIAQGIVTMVAGIASLALQGGSVQTLFFVVTVFAAITGVLELVSGVRTRRRFVGSIDWIAIGGLTVLTALVFVLIPPGYSQTYTVDGGKHILDAAVVAVGFLGIYGAVSTVYLVIAGLSAKWGTQSKGTPAVSAPAETSSVETEERS